VHMVKTLLERMLRTRHGRAGAGSGKDLVRRVDSKGLQALHYAASGGNWDVMRALVRAGAHVDCRDGEEMTPLHILAMSGRAEWLGKTVKELGADALATDADGQTALHLAARCGQVCPGPGRAGGCGASSVCPV
jgi:ankyrin repeat protein